MALAFVRSEQNEAEEIRRFLARAFGLSEDAPFVEPRLTDWKWFTPRPDWEGSRSYALRQDGRLAAHGCAYPAKFLTCTGEVTSARVIDWGGGSEVPGAGVLLFRKFAGLVQTLLAVGGSAETQAILPKIGFRRTGELALYARPARPLRQARLAPQKDWRWAARAARNTLWARRRSVEIPAALSARRVPRFGRMPVPAASAEFTPAWRSTDILNAMLACPGAAVSAFEILENDAISGYFVLSRVGGQTRIADLWTTGDWAMAFALATREAARDRETCEIMAVGSIDRVRKAIEANGFVGRGAEPVFLYDPKKLLAGAPPLHVQLLDGDEWFLNNPDYPFLT